MCHLRLRGKLQHLKIAKQRLLLKVISSIDVAAVAVILFDDVGDRGGRRRGHQGETPQRIGPLHLQLPPEIGLERLRVGARVLHGGDCRGGHAEAVATFHRRGVVERGDGRRGGRGRRGHIMVESSRRRGGEGLAAHGALGGRHSAAAPGGPTIFHFARTLLAGAQMGERLSRGCRFRAGVPR